MFCCGHNLRPLTRGRALDLGAFTRGRLPDLCCLRSENPRDRFVFDLDSVNDLDFFRWERFCGLSIVCLRLIFDDLFILGSVLTRRFCRFNRGFLTVCFELRIVLPLVAFLVENTLFETLGAFLEGRLYCLSDFNLDTVLFLIPLIFPSTGTVLAFFR